MITGRRETAFLLLGDIILLVLSLWAALALRNLEIPGLMYYLDHVRAFSFVFAISLLIFYISGLYERRTRLVKRILGVRIAGAQVANTLIAAVLFFVLPLSIAPKTILAIYLVISVVLITVWRFFFVPALSLADRARAMIVGEGETVDEVVNVVNGNRKYYIEFPQHLCPSAIETGALRARIQEAVAADIRIVVLDTRDPRVRAELPTLYDAMLEGVAFIEFSTFYEGLFDRVPLAHIDHAWLLEQLPGRNLPYALMKRGTDILGALIGILVSAPFLLFGALAIILTTTGPVFIHHDRIGRRGKCFSILKLRTMLINDHGDPELQKRNRVTRVGKILRKTRIDELPQLWNILRGDLSFIGPRPELPKIAAVYEREIPYYDVRHLITPGLSGWAQIYDADAPRGAADVERTRRKLSYDIYYLKHRSLSIDIAIALKTLRALASFSGT